MTASALEAPDVQPAGRSTPGSRRRRLPGLHHAAALLALVLATSPGCQAGERTVTVQASAETEPVSSAGDAADDAAIWVNHADPAASLIIGTDKKHGLEVYRLDGSLLQSLLVGRMNNVDVRDGFALGGRSVAIVAASDRERDAIALFAIAPGDLALIDVADGVLATGLGKIYGLCMYAQRATGRMFVFVNDKDGRYQQHELEARPGGRIGTRLVREFRLAGQPEGCAADDELGWLYVGEERAGFHRLAAAPEAPATLVTVDRIGTGRLVADVEGIAIQRHGAGTGYLLVSSQGDDAFAVYRRAPPNEYVGRFRIVDGQVDGVTHTDGLDVTDAALPPPFDEGLLVVQDDRNTGPDARQDFKLVAWREVKQALGLDH
jgi:3-phytase